MELFDELVECEVAIIAPHLNSVLEFCLTVSIHALRILHYTDPPTYTACTTPTHTHTQRRTHSYTASTTHAQTSTVNFAISHENG